MQLTGLTHLHLEELQHRTIQAWCRMMHVNGHPHMATLAAVGWFKNHVDYMFCIWYKVHQQRTAPSSAATFRAPFCLPGRAVLFAVPNNPQQIGDVKNFNTLYANVFLTITSSSKCSPFVLLLY